MSQVFLVNIFQGDNCLAKQLTKVRDKTQIERFLVEDRFTLLMYLIILRVFPGSPNWAMNLVFPHLGVPVKYIAISMFLGLLPWNYMTCAAGKG